MKLICRAFLRIRAVFKNHLGGVTEWTGKVRATTHNFHITAGWNDKYERVKRLGSSTDGNL